MVLPAEPTATSAVAVDQRARILDIALRLMAEGGLHGTSMRKLAAACDLNVATLYHYFPSKQELFAEAVAHQRVDLLLGEPPPVDVTLPPADRLAATLRWLLGEIPTRGEHIWRLLLGESLRGEPVVVEAAASLSATFEEGLRLWLEALFPDIDIDCGSLARLLRSTVYGCIVEGLLEPDDWARLVDERARDVASLTFGH